MKIRLPLMIQDPLVAGPGAKRLTDGWDGASEPFYLDGPVTRRVAVLDFDAKTARLRGGTRFLPPGPRRVLAAYGALDPERLSEDDLLRVTPFTTVLKTLDLFEDAAALGHPVEWAFGAQQLLVVPRAGEWANAFYERASHSLQFFSFPSPTQPDQLIHTALSRDIVAHEAGHAILDGVVPDLYNAISPQSLALHEAIADLSALLLAFDSKSLRERVLKETQGSIGKSSAFSAIGEQVGQALDRSGRHDASLRDLENELTLDPSDGVPPDDPHALSEVLTGALYRVMVDIHTTLRKRIAERDGISEYSASGEALMTGAKRFKHLFLGALDYLPPGEVSFVDYARAVIAVDQAGDPDNRLERDAIRREFVQRLMAPNLDTLEVSTNFRNDAVRGIDLTTLVESDWAAYEFANRHRGVLGIPEGVHFRVRPRVRRPRAALDGEQGDNDEECIFKVSWDVKEVNPLGYAFPNKRQITAGTTMVIDWRTRDVLARLTSSLVEPAFADAQRADRDLLLRRLADSGVLRVGDAALGPDGKVLRSAIRAEAMDDGLMRLRATARLLHAVTAWE